MLYLDGMSVSVTAVRNEATASWPQLPLLPYQTVEKNGAVYTKQWVVDLILDLAGYKSDLDLAKKNALEPAVGNGAFLLPMVKRLLTSCRLHGRTLTETEPSLLAYEIDVRSADIARSGVATFLQQEGVPPYQAKSLACAWVHNGDFLLKDSSQMIIDFAIGNPPYIRLEDINPTMSALYRERYPTMIGRADLYIAFFEASLRQLAPAGVCAFICADRWMLNQYGAELRRLVTSGYSVEAVVEMHRADAFETEVSAYPAVTIIRRAPQAAAVVASANPDAPIDGAELAHAIQTERTAAGHVRLPTGVRAARTETWFQDAEPWPCVSPDRLALLKRLEREFLPLESAATGTAVSIGVATGCDEVFITRNPRLVEPSRLYPLAMAFDAAAGQFTWSGHYLVNPWDEDGLVKLADFPRLARHFQSHEARLRARSIGRRNPERWYRTIDRVNPALLSRRKLYFPDIRSRIYPVLDEGQTYPHHNLYYIQSDAWDMEALGGLLLSRVAQFFVECYGVRMRGGYLRFQAQYLRRIRVPDLQQIAAEQAQALRCAFRAHDVERATAIAMQLYQIEPRWEELLGQPEKPGRYE